MAKYKYSDRFDAIFNYPRNFLKFCGSDVIEENHKFGWRAMTLFVLTNVGCYLTIHTALVEAFTNGDYYIFLKSVAVIGTGIQGYVKFVSGHLCQDNFQFLYKEILDMYKTYELKSLSYQNCLKYNISLLKKLLIILGAIVIPTTLIVIGIPIFKLVILKTRTETLPFRVPFLDFKTDIGFYVTFVIQIICVIFGGLGNTALDTMLFIFVAHIPLSKNILKCKFDDLNEVLEKHPRDIEISSAPLIEIFKWHQKYITFCNCIKDTFFSVIFVQIGCEFFGIACTTVCIFLGIWPPAPIYLLYLFALVYAYCFLGNLVEMANDDVTDMIYNFCWYNLTIPEQKMVLIMLRESQQAAGLSIGGVAPLSMNTALQLTKTIYTLSMMLKEFLN